MKIGQYTLVNDAKAKRAAAGKTDEKEILAAYDMLGGLVLENGTKLPTGTFYDFENKKAKEFDLEGEEEDEDDEEEEKPKRRGRPKKEDEE